MPNNTPKNPKVPPSVTVRESGYGYDYDDSTGEPKISDLSRQTKLTIASYMTGLTRGQPGLRQTIEGVPATPPHANRQSLPTPDLSFNDKASLNDPTTGFPNPVSTSTDEFAFVPVDSTDARSNSFRTKSPDYDVAAASTNTKIWAGGDRNAPQNLNGNNLLGSVSSRVDGNKTSSTLKTDPTGVNEVFVGGYQSQVLSRNRFTGGINVGTSNVQLRQQQAAERTISNKYSEFAVPNVIRPGSLTKPQDGPTSSAESLKDGDRVELGQLALVGHNLMARSAGIQDSGNPGFDATAAVAPYKAAVPNGAMMGIAYFDKLTYDIKDIIEKMSKDVYPAVDPTVDKDGGNGSAEWNSEAFRQKSYGSFYTSLNPFSSGSPSEVVQNVILIAVTELLEVAFLALANKFNKPDLNASYTVYANGEKNVIKPFPAESNKFVQDARSTDPSAKREKYTLGSYLYTDGSTKLWRGLEQFLGIVQPRNTSYGSAISLGISAFMGGDIIRLPNGTYSANKFSILLKVLTENQQSKIITFRSILRYLAEFVRKLASTTPAGAVILLSNAVLVTIKESKIISILNRFSQLGDAVHGPPGTNQDGQEVINAIGDTIVQNVFEKSQNGERASVRTKSGALKASVSNIKSHLLPPVGNNYTFINEKIEISKREYDTKLKQINKDQARILESTLSAEYVPFYFRDLRTNEMIGFHAFLKSLTDNYTPGYDSQEFFGRGEPVHTFKGSTTRDINLSFVIAAMSPEDFKAMWYKINKLTTLVYPQYSQGRQISYDDTKITQPFSQVISASPMIRLRIGDVMQSNYNESSIRNLFGEGTLGYGVVNDKDLEIYKRFFNENKELSPPDSNNVQDWANVIYSYDTRNFDAIDRLISNQILMEIPEEFLMTKKFEQFAIDQKVMTTKDFYSEKDNAIVKSFKDNGAGDTGGLAGFIGSLQFNWLGDSYSWETNDLNGDPSRKSKLGVAPKLVEVQMGFKPIHDIAPGLNSDGFNRAPIYPLKFMRDILDKK